MMTLSDRIFVLNCIFEDLQATTSINEKRQIASEVPEMLKDDFEFVVECLNGVHKFGYTYYHCDMGGDVRNENNTVKDVLEFLLEPMKLKNLTQSNIAKYISQTYPWASFFEPIVNRELKLGIGKSILPKDGLSAMLAKKYEGTVKHTSGGYYVTEKLDGNRCIARFDGERWIFTSRNGKPMHVNFDMSGLPREYVYDGEILSPGQTQMSRNIYDLIVNDNHNINLICNDFNSTSGMINRHSLDKKLIYNIFDIMPSDDVEYKYRRDALDYIDKIGKFNREQVRILPIITRYSSAEELNANIKYILGKVIENGGEGLMINLGGGNYIHKRTDQLLKYKDVKTMDMEVTNVQWGTGKYEGMIGALECEMRTSDGKFVTCKVGSGLSDEQRFRWAMHPDEIIGRIVEVKYFSLSQSEDTSNTNIYSLRFPRLCKVRFDKENTSEY